MFGGLELDVKMLDIKWNDTKQTTAWLVFMRMYA